MPSWSLATRTRGHRSTNRGNCSLVARTAQIRWCTAFSRSSCPPEPGGTSRQSTIYSAGLHQFRLSAWSLLSASSTSSIIHESSKQVQGRDAPMATTAEPGSGPGPSRSLKRRWPHRTRLPHDPIGPTAS